MNVPKFLSSVDLAYRHMHFALRRAEPAVILVILPFLVTNLPAATNTPAGSATEAPRVKRGTLPQVELINQKIRDGWAAHKLAPSPPASDGEWCRRVYLDVLGRVPTVAELTEYVEDRSPDKKAALVNRLLGEPYIADFARNWTTLWTNVLVGRVGGSDEDRMTNREGLQQSLRRALQRDMPYNRMVYELVSATGISRPGEESFNGFVNFLANKMADGGIQATAKTAQIFLGLQVQCTQCHNHPFNEWKQNQFWELNAYFRQTAALRRYQNGRQLRYVELVNQDFEGENKNPAEAAVFYELRNGITKVAYPTFVDGQPLSNHSGYLQEVDRRTELAKLIMNSPYLAKAAVNRVWAHFFGYGFTKPIDDLGPHNPPTHPDLLDGLADELRARSYDLKQVMRWIILSEPYSLSSKYTKQNKRDDPALGERPMFSRFYLRQMRAEELYESLLVATHAHKTRGGYEEQEAAKAEWLKQFVIAFGTDDNEETTTFNGTITQTLMMMNGELVNSATSIEKGSFLERIATHAGLDNAGKIKYLYKAALARSPSKEEVQSANKLLASHQGNAIAALQDIWWALLNSNEFIINH